VSSHAERLAAGLVDRYRVERKLGEGGMATVYLAEDLRHRRRVAIKMVHPELSAVLGSERFLKEIELTASLQHPHILPLFDSGAAEGLLYYVMPYIEGESLRARMERERPLPVQDAVRITKQVAQALDYAHRHGIVHRDIKPENILLHEDSALVADFGIALAVQSAGGSRLTQTGLSLGTPQYMSPEQAMGERHVDARTDIYALGAVAYEMLAGEPPFTGGTAQAIVAKVITEKPAPLSSHRDTVPAHVAAAVHVALSKLAADRWASARDFATALEEGGRVTMPVAGRSTVALSTPQPARLGRFAALGAVAAATLALGAVLGWSLRKSAPVAESRLEILRGLEGVGGIALSPDGRLLAASSAGAGGEFSIRLRPIDRLASQPVPGTEGGATPAFSPDGRTLAFLRDEGPRQRSLWRVGLDGSPPVRLADSAGNIDQGPPSWSDDGWIYFIRNEGVLSRVRQSGGPVETLAVPDPELGAGFGFVQAVPGGKRLLVSLLRLSSTHTQHEFATWNLATRGLTVLGRGIGAHPMPGGQLIYLDANGVLYRVRFDAQRGRLEGAPEPVADQVRMPIGGVIVFAASRAGDIAYRASPAVNGIRRSLIRVDRAGHVLPLPLPIDAYSSFRVSPDGRRMVLEQTVEGADGGNIFVLSIGDSVMRPFARTGISNYPVWSPDGRRVAWSRLLDGERDIVWQDVDGADSARVMLRRPGEQWQVEFVPGTDRALVREGNATGGPQNLDIVGFRPGSDSVFPFAVRPNVLERAPRASPDGRWVAYVSNETGRDEVFVRPFPGGPAVQVSDGGGAEPVWARERRELFYKGNDDFLAAQFGPGSPFTTVARRKLFSVKRGFFNNPWAARYDVLPGDSTFLMLDPGDDASQADVRTILIQHPAFLADR